MSSTAPVLIVGGGWAGMAAALELDAHDIPVTLFESARKTGGRARSVELDGITFDNGQHLLIGAYHETLRLLARLGLAEDDVLLRQPLRLEVRDTQRNIVIDAPPLPAPVHLLWALLGARGLSKQEKYRAIRMSLALAVQHYRIAEDISVSELLQQHRQGDDIIRRFWEPLCLATLNTPPERASAAVFLRVLEDSFSKRRRDADLLLPRVPLGELFSETAARYLQNAPGHNITLGQRVLAVEHSDGKVTGVSTAASTFTSDDVIIATSPSAAVHLLSTVQEANPLCSKLSMLGFQPITTVYLYYPDAPPMQQPMLGFSGTCTQWLFDRAVCRQPGWYAVVISADGEHTAWDKQQLSSRVQSELAHSLPGWPDRAERGFVIREKRATFDCRVGINDLRPANRTGIPGLWLAGDYTDTGYPATLEGAVRSGVQCAHQIIAQRHTRH